MALAFIDTFRCVHKTILLNLLTVFTIWVSVSICTYTKDSD